MSDETQNRKTRRAQRRAAKDEPSTSSKGTSSKGVAAKGALSARNETKPKKTTSIRDEGLKAREAAVARRREKRSRERSEAAAEGLDTSELVDDALARGAQATSRFVQRHFKWMQWLILAGVVGGFGSLIYNYRVELDNQKASTDLMQGLNAELGRLKGDEDLNQVSGFVDMRPEFESDAARLKAAAEGYKKAISDDTKEERRTLAKLGLAGVLFDQEKYKEAEQAYREVRDSALGARDVELKGRASEGMGLSQEALGQKDVAAKTFQELENLGGSFVPLAQYHRARLEYAKGNRDKAKELLKKVLEKSKKDETSALQGPGFVNLAAQQLLEAIDPSAAKPAETGLSPEQLKKIQEQLKKAAGLKGADDPNMEELMKSINSSLGKEGAPAPAAPAPTAPEPLPAPAPLDPAPKSAPKAPARPPAHTPKPPAPAAPPKPAPTPAAPPAAPAPAPAAPPPAPVAPAPLPGNP